MRVTVLALLSMLFVLGASSDDKDKDRGGKPAPRAEAPGRSSTSSHGSQGSTATPARGATSTRSRESAPAGGHAMPPAGSRPDAHSGMHRADRPDTTSTAPSPGRPGSFSSPGGNSGRSGGGSYTPSGDRTRTSTGYAGGPHDIGHHPVGTTPLAGGGMVHHTRAGSEVHYGEGGRITAVQRNGVTITHGPGNRMIVNRPDGRVIVTNRNGHGFVQRDFSYESHVYVTRTYYVGGRTYARYYRPYNYHGVVLVGYVPTRYYPSAFYGWAYHPWGSPVYFRWGWYSDPWYGYYGPYFAPAPYYPSPALWLADYLISQQLMLAYQERAAAQASYAPAGQLTPEVKELVAEEVQRQLALENQEARSMGQANNADAEPVWLSGSKPHMFLVSYNLDVRDPAGRVCSVTRGDVLQLSSPPPPEAIAAYVRVLASTGRGCPRGATVAVELTDLQDMNNQMRESLNQGMGELQSKAGQNGIPAMPPAAAAPPIPAGFAQAAPPPDANVATELRQQVQEADRIEQETVAEARAEGAPVPQAPAGIDTIPPATSQSVELRPGQSPAEVKAILGDPLQVIRLQNKEIYRYKDVKVTFVNDKVTNIE